MYWNLSTWLILVSAYICTGTFVATLEVPEVEYIVNTKYGPVRAVKTLEEDAYIFLDIPYGKITKLFQGPSPPDPWDEVLHNIDHNKKCPQLQDANTVVGDTDCLTLSVFKPINVDSTNVLFHIHDGKFISGSGDPSVYGPKHLLSKGVIVVLPNYRLGSLGFLCLQNEIAPGNAALKDLTLALEWTAQNIAEFGGNPSDISVSGDGMSGALAGYLALSSNSNKYIAKVITESGSVLSHWALDRHPLETATLFIENLHKDVVENEEVDLTEVENLVNIIKAGGNIAFKPCVEIPEQSSFITKTPWKILHDEETKINIPFMIGSANHAGMHEALSHSDESLINLNKEFSKFLPNDLYFYNDEEKNEIADKIKLRYFKENEISRDQITTISLAYTDASYLGPAIRMARTLLDVGATVYFYEFAFTGAFNREHIALDSEIEGAARGDIVGYVFSQGEERPTEGSPEERTLELVTDLWTSFIKEGKPTTTDNSFVWNELKKTTELEEEWLSINSEVKLEKSLHVHRLELWTEIYSENYIDLVSDMESGGEQTITEGDIIETEHGSVQGYKMHTSYDIQSFLDIPYGVFRGPFEEPTQPDPWENVINNKEHKIRCPQLQDSDTVVGDINCLTLSVFAPLDAANASVLFHVHDGQFVSGSGDPSIYGPENLVSKGIILVLPNYRLGPLGFLCLRNDTAPGNAALKDLTLALNWTKNNIKEFGGNPSGISVSGDGTSGALVGFLTLSPKSRNYISKAIIESGTVLSHWALDRDPLDTASTFFEKLLEIGEIFHTDDILQESNVQTLIKAAKDIEFRPCVEDEEVSTFMTQTPWEVLNSVESTNISFMLGSANYAGMQEALAYTEDTLKQLDENFEDFLPNDLEFDSDDEKSKIADTVRSIYFSDESLNVDMLSNLSLAYTDAWYLGPGIRTARALLKVGATVYFYEFAFVGTFNRELISLGNKIQGAARGDIVGYVFTQDGELPEDGSDEKRTLNLMTDLWISFIQTGKPTSENMACVEWKYLEPGQEEENEEWLSIASEIEAEKGLHVDRLKIWTDIYNEHFIEHNFGLKHNPSIFLTFIATLVFLTDFRQYLFNSE